MVKHWPVKLTRHDDYCLSVNNFPQKDTASADAAPHNVESESDLNDHDVHSTVTERTPTAMVHALMTEKIKHGTEDAFYISDMGAVVRQHHKWLRLLPRVEPFYAVKCNSNPEVLHTLQSLGTGFDCASRGEMEAMLQLGVDPSRLIYANPCKQASHIVFARDHNVTMMTFDNASELYKVQQLFPAAKLVLRVLTDDSRSVCQLGTKFGVRPENTRSLLETAKKLNMNVIGVSFHVGSGCRDRMAFVDAVRRARRVFDEGTALGFHFSLLDVGGGFPGANTHVGASGADTSPVTFEGIADVLRPAIDEYFPKQDMPHLRVIAEPGRYYVAAAFTLAVCITSRRVIVPSDGTLRTDADIEGLLRGKAFAGDNEVRNAAESSALKFMYYVNDGVYGSFNCLLFDHAHVEPLVLSCKGNIVGLNDVLTAPRYACSVWGPTCDSLDCLNAASTLPELDVGDWLYFENMGAYTVAAASCFNGFALSHIYYIDTSADVDADIDMSASSSDYVSSASVSDVEDMSMIITEQELDVPEYSVATVSVY